MKWKGGIPIAGDQATKYCSLFADCPREAYRKQRVLPFRILKNNGIEYKKNVAASIKISGSKTHQLPLLQIFQQYPADFD